MIRRPPRSTRTYTRFPYTTLFRSSVQGCWASSVPASSSRLLPRCSPRVLGGANPRRGWRTRSEEHTSELQSLMRISYAVFCLKQKIHNQKKLLPHTAQHQKLQKPGLHHNTNTHDKQNITDIY